MSRPDRLRGGVSARFHPVSHYSSPADVLNDGALSSTEKPVILSSWASDVYAVDSQPALPRIAISTKSRWSSEANVRRYRRLLATQLTENERRYVERRLAEELAELRSQTDAAESCSWEPAVDLARERGEVCEL